MTAPFLEGIVHDQGGQVQNLKAAIHGARGDGRIVTDGIIRATSLSVLESASASFSQSDVGKLALIAGAGANGEALATSIVAYSPISRAITLAHRAVRPVSRARVTFGTNDHPAFQHALGLGSKFVYVPDGIFLLAAPVSVTVAADLVFFGAGRIVWAGPSTAGELFHFACAGRSVAVRGLTFEGSRLIAAGLRVVDATPMTERLLPTCTVEGNRFLDFRMNTPYVYNVGAAVVGSFERVVIRANDVIDISRAAGTGTPGSTGTAGIIVAPYNPSYWPRRCFHEGNVYRNVVGDDLSGVTPRRNVDYDGFQFFSPDPGTNPDSGGIGREYLPASVVSRGNTYHNCRGRAIKIQGLAEISNETIIRDGDMTIDGGSDEISLQWGVGTVRDIRFFYSDYRDGTTQRSPIRTPLVLVAAWQGQSYGEVSTSLTVSGLRVHNRIPSGLGAGLGAVLDIRGGVGRKDRPLVQLSDVTVSRGVIDWVVLTGFEGGARCLLRLDSIVIERLRHSVVGSDSANPNCDLIATGVMHLQGSRQAASATPFFSRISSPEGGPLAWAGKFSVSMNVGVG